MKNLVLIFLFLSNGFGVLAQQTNKYCNSQFGFCVDVPVSFKRMGASKTGDGQFFTAKDGALLSVFGIYITQAGTIKQRFETEQAAINNDSSFTNTTQLPTIEKAELQENSYVIVYLNKNFSNLIYRKLENSVWKNMELRYPTAKTKEYTEIANRLIAGFK